MQRTAAPPAHAPAPTGPPIAFTPGLRADGTRAYAGFWIRAAAMLVDDVLIGVPFYLLTRSFGDLGYVFLALGSLLYFPIMESSSAQGTVGKLVFGLKVTDTSYRRISLARAFGRYLAHIRSGVLLYLGYVMVAFTPQKRALHDYIAGTLVLRT